MIVGLHGFLGRSEDWSFWPEVRPVDLWQYAGQTLEKTGHQVMSDHQNAVVMGYSMGGRIALSGLSDHPPKALVLISVHPGLADTALRDERLRSDRQWAEKFRQTPWNSLMDQWHQQPVFSGHRWERNETQFDREKLAESLENWSLGHQPDQRPTLAKELCPCLWLVGTRDSKFVELAETVPGVEKRQIAGCGHRIIFEKPSELREIVEPWLNQVL